MAKKKKLRSQELSFAKLGKKGIVLAPGEKKRPYGNSWVLPGEQARAILAPRPKKRHTPCWIQQVTRPSPERRQPLCPHFGFCGGCSFQHTTLEHQLHLKSQPLHDTILQLEPDTELLPPVPSPKSYYYRSKVEFSFSQYRDQFRLGFHRKGQFSWVFNCEECFIAPPSSRPILKTVREWALTNQLKGWNHFSQEGDLRFLVLRWSEATKQMMIALVHRKELSKELLDTLIQELKEYHLHSFWSISQSAVSDAIVPEKEELLWGSPTIEQPLGDLRFQLGWRSFFQANPKGFELMLQEAKSWLKLPEKAKVLDLYCGIGTIGLTLTPPQGTLVGVENVEMAVRDAQKTCQEQGYRGEFFCQPSEEFKDLTCDLLVLDPPRSGCHPKMIDNILETPKPPPQILYIACNPQQFFRDYERLQEKYTLTKSRCFDFFPNTPHIEMMSLLERKL